MPLPMYQEKEQIQTGIGEISHILLVSAGKGGVGKSLVSANLALALKAQGFRVGLLDADLYGPSLKKMLTIDRFPQREEGVLLPALCHGIKMVSMAFFQEEEEASAVRAPIANRLIHQLIHEVSWGNLDFLIVDTPPGTGDIPITLAQQLPVAGAVLVSTPQEVAVLDVSKVVTMFSRMKIPLLGLLENMSYLSLPEGGTLSPFGKGGAKKFTLEQGIPFLGELPIDPQLCACHDRGESLFSKEKESETVELFLNVASRLVKVLTAEASTDVKNISIVCEPLPLQPRLEGSIRFEKEAYAKNEGTFIKRIFQRDETSFTIEWTNEGSSSFHFSELQRFCPCAGCVDEKSERRLSNPDTIPKGLKARRIESVGRYALRFHFLSGCSNGIYTFPFLKSLSRVSAL